MYRFHNWILFVVFGQSFLIISQTGTAFAVSPSYGSQEVTDPPYDFKFLDVNRNFLNRSHELENHTSNTGDIIAVNYFSDGKVLDLTYWLSKQFEKSPNRHLPLYGVNFDVDSNVNTGGSLGIDYRVIIQWNNVTKKWENVVEKVAPDESVHVLYYNNSYSNYVTGNNFYSTTDQSVNSWFPNNCCNYTHFTIDLGLFGYPEKYVLYFFQFDEFSLANGTKRFAEDSTPNVRVPPPKFEMITIPQIVELRPNDTKTVEIRVNSTFDSGSRVFLRSNGSKDILMQPELSEVYLPPNGINSTFLKITALKSADKDAIQDLYSPNLIGYVQYPSFDEYGFLYFEDFQNHPPDYTIITPVEIVVDPPLSAEQKFTSFWNTYGNIITVFGGGFAGGFAGWFFGRIESKKKH